MVTRVLVGDTVKHTFINSGATASPITSSLLSGSETIISSQTATSSGNGHYYAMTQINTPGYYVLQWNATISGNPYKRRLRIKAYNNEVD